MKRKRRSIRELAENVRTTEDAAHQLAFFEGVGALDALLAMPQRVRAVTTMDVQRVARTYLRMDQWTVGWMARGAFLTSRPGAAAPKRLPIVRARHPQLVRQADRSFVVFPGGLPAIVHPKPFVRHGDGRAAVDRASRAGSHPHELPGTRCYRPVRSVERARSADSQSISTGRQRRTHEEDAEPGPDEAAAATDPAAARPANVQAHGHDRQWRIRERAKRRNPRNRRISVQSAEPDAKPAPRLLLCASFASG